MITIMQFKPNSTTHVSRPVVQSTEPQIHKNKMQINNKTPEVTHVTSWAPD